MHSGGYTANHTVPNSAYSVQRKHILTNATNAQSKIMKTQTNVMHTSPNPKKKACKTLHKFIRSIC